MSYISSVSNIASVNESNSFKPSILADLNFRSKNGIAASSNVRIVDAQDVVWNEVCKTSHKWDVYPLDVREGREPGIPSSLTFDVDLSQLSSTKIELKLFACAREDVGKGLISIDINGLLAVEKVAVYDGFDFELPPHLVEKNDGKAIDHLDETTIDITDFVQKGLNRIQIRLNPATESGVSIRWIEIVQSN